VDASAFDPPAQEEVRELVGVGRWQKALARKDRRNGSSMRGLMTSGGTSLGAGALLSAFSLSALIERRPIGSLEAMDMGAGLGLLAAGTGALLLTSEEEALARRLATLDTSSERARAASVLLMERDFERAAAESRRKQNLISAIIIGEGAILTGVVTHSLLTNSARMTPEQGRGAFFNLAASVGFTLTGVLHSLFYESGTSRAWRFYLSGRRLAGSGDTAPSKGGAEPSDVRACD
jgi:hypothetical protein